jgi:hypothetical protein
MKTVAQLRCFFTSWNFELNIMVICNLNLDRVLWARHLRKVLLFPADRKDSFTQYSRIHEARKRVK